MLFSIYCDGRAAFIYLLFEHQSSSDPLMLFRLRRYMTDIGHMFPTLPKSLEISPSPSPTLSERGQKGRHDMTSKLSLQERMIRLHDLMQNATDLSEPIDYFTQNLASEWKFMRQGKRGNPKLTPILH